MKRMLILTAAICLYSTTCGHAALTWYQDGQPVDEVTVEVGQQIFVQLYSDIPTYHPYDVIMGTGVAVVPGAVHGVGIAHVEPLYLAGDMAQATALLGAINFNLHCDWGTIATPVSHWGEHWEVTLTGLQLGTYTVHSDWGQVEGPDDVLAVSVVPEPASLILLGLGAAALRRRS